jgi:hypothetical protein
VARIKVKVSGFHVKGTECKVIGYGLGDIHVWV